MSTRGVIGIRYNNIDKVGYNHSDSYPTGLGKQVLRFLKRHSVEQLIKTFNNIKLVDNSENDGWDWRNECFNNQFKDYHKFLYKSLMCEFGYIINLDEQTLEFYKGFNKDCNALGRYANCQKDDVGYCGVKLIMTIPLKEINQYQVFEENNEEGFRKIN